MKLFDQFFDQVPHDPGKIVTDPPALLNTVVVDDRTLGPLDRAAESPVAVTVINGTGAGGIPALARRNLTHCRLAAVQNPLRDPGDLVGNVARIAAAARELDPDIAVLVEIPDGFGWQDAVATAEAEGLIAVVSLASDPARMSAYVEADLPFVVDGIESASDLVGLLTAVDVLVETGEVEDAAAALAADHDQQAAAIRDWTDQQSARVRRQLRAVRTEDLPKLITELEAYGPI